MKLVNENNVLIKEQKNNIEIYRKETYYDIQCKFLFNYYNDSIKNIFLKEKVNIFTANTIFSYKEIIKIIDILKNNHKNKMNKIYNYEITLMKNTSKYFELKLEAYYYNALKMDFKINQLLKSEFLKNKISNYKKNINKKNILFDEKINILINLINSFYENSKNYLLENNKIEELESKYLLYFNNLTRGENLGFINEVYLEIYKSSNNSLKIFKKLCFYYYLYLIIKTFLNNNSQIHETKKIVKLLDSQINFYLNKNKYFVNKYLLKDFIDQIIYIINIFF